MDQLLHEKIKMITREKVKETAKLAALSFNDNELSLLHKELARILEWVTMLDEVDTENMSCLVTPEEHTSLPMHEDKVTEEANTKEILRNAPATLHDCYFSVPKMIEGA